jgi:hypothetical protein
VSLRRSQGDESLHERSIFWRRATNCGKVQELNAKLRSRRPFHAVWLGKTTACRGYVASGQRNRSEHARRAQLAQVKARFAERAFSDEIEGIGPAPVMMTSLSLMSFVMLFSAKRNWLGAYFVGGRVYRLIWMLSSHCVTSRRVSRS